MYTVNSATQPSVVGVLGGIGSGKSTLALAVARELSGVVINADVYGHEVLTEPNVVAQLRAAFGPKIADAQGVVSRKQLAAIVFGPTSEHASRLHQLEAMMHPRIREKMEHELTRIASLSADTWVLVDAPLLLEAGWDDLCDLLVFVDVSPEIRFSRVAATRGWTREEWSQREAQQWSIDRKRAASDFCVNNEGTPTVAAAELVRLLQQQRSTPSNRSLLPVS